MCTNLCFGFEQPSYIKKRNNQTYKQYLRKKQQLNLPKYIANYFNCLENSSNFKSKNQIKQQKKNQIQCVNQNFFVHFKKLSQKQQGIYLMQLLKQIQTKGKQREDHHFQKTLTAQTVEDMIDSSKYIQSYCKMSTTRTGFKSWKTINLKLNVAKKRLTVGHNNMVFQIPVRSYMIRSSKNNIKSFILDTLHDYEQSNLRKLSFQIEEDSKLQQFYTKILGIIIQYQVDKLFMQVQFKQKMEKINSPYENKIKIFLTKSNIQSYRNYVAIFQKSRLKSNEASITIYSEKNITIQKIKSKQHPYYKAFIQREDYHKCSTINFIQVYTYFHRCVSRFNIMEKNIQKNAKIVAVYQKLKLDNKQYAQQLIIQKNRSQNEQFFTIVNLDHTLNQNFIELIKIKIAQGKPGETILIQIQAKFNQYFNEDSILEYLKQFKHMFQRLYQAPQRQKNQTQLQESKSKFYIQNDLISKFGQQQFDQNFIKKIGKRSSFKQMPVNAYLKHKYRVQPTQQKIGKIMKIHFLYNEWQRIKKGGLRCKNQELIQFQKSLYKKVMKKFGQNLLKGKNIINFSLPVQCFKKESHLQSLANSMLYSPIYIQKASKIKDPIERMKQSVVLMIAIGILTINTQKPFNPILGQTFQGWIDGCPIYLQQISHHPPISAYYMVGRGYKVYGCVQPRISLGFNSASGYSLLPHYIQFDDGTIIQIIFGRIVISGMLFGDRQFYFEDKIYSYDKKHNLFAQLNFGPIKSGGIFSSSSEPEDYFHGKIYEVTKQFKQIFQKSSPKVYPQKQHIIKTISIFDGIWSGTVHIDGQQYINFRSDLPYEFTDQDYPIPSDSRNRQDLRTLIGGNMEQAQRNKQIMEQEQRNDKKLRQKYGKKT